VANSDERERARAREREREREERESVLERVSGQGDSGGTKI
jgi:hypothetical protein